MLSVSVLRLVYTSIIAGATLSVGIYSFELYRAHSLLIAAVPQYHSTLSYLVDEQAHLQMQYQMTIDALALQLEKKNDELEVLDSRLEQVESAFDVGFSISPQITSMQERLSATELDIKARRVVLFSIPNGSPLKYRRISSLYGERHHPIYGKQKFHQGIDLVCRIGDPIIAPADGVVEIARLSSKGYGNFLTVRHGFGFMTSYAHLSSFKVKSGNFVRKGEVIATCGNSGNSTGPHLHYEVRFIGRLLDPKTLMDWSMKDFMLPFEKEKIVNWRELIALMDKNIEQM
ncbi:M23 family metallopeptidase [Vibrio campbellii]|uniref:M23 family metallopeptidase n=1 Tax=Vibrio campbellii TaxID=680 RepID=UPI0040561094